MENLWAEAEMDGETERWERDREGSVCMAWMASGLMWVTACSFSVSLRDDEHCGFWTLREGASQKGPGPEPCTALWNCREQAGSRGICMNSYMHILARIWCQGDLGIYYIYRILVPGWPWYILCVQGKASRASDPIPWNLLTSKLTGARASCVKSRALALLSKSISRSRNRRP